MNFSVRIKWYSLEEGGRDLYQEQSGSCLMNAMNGAGCVCSVFIIWDGEHALVRPMSNKKFLQLFQNEEKIWLTEGYTKMGEATKNEST